MKRQATLGLVGLLAAVFVLAASCGGPAAEGGNADRGEKNSGGRSSGTVGSGGYSDKRFIDKMVPHHRSAVEMAEVALKNAEHREIKELSKNIVATQRAEITELKEAKKKEFGTSEVSPGMGMGQMQGMGMMNGADLANKKPFDRAFIDAMIPHHESAVEMAEAARERSDNPRIRALAENIVGAQRREIFLLRSWRDEWYPEG